jgi:hypothetical protein
MASLTPETFLEVGHAMIDNLGTMMAILMPAAILAVVPVLYLLYRSRSSALPGAGWVCVFHYGANPPRVATMAVPCCSWVLRWLCAVAISV